MNVVSVLKLESYFKQTKFSSRQVSLDNRIHPSWAKEKGVLSMSPASQIIYPSLFVFCHQSPVAFRAFMLIETLQGLWS